MDTIGGRIAKIRKEQELTQEKLAELSNISVQFLSDIENNKKSMTVTTLRKIADTLNVTTDYIIYGRTTMNETSLINSMLETLSAKNQKKAEKLLEIFVNAVNDKSE
ncbi:MAG: helix-turn-helix transcriptional regulator [Ruminococcus sp.]|nr:helix-turn-helix transcriptional regulator [Ruminococcus sp.]